MATKQIVSFAPISAFPKASNVGRRLKGKKTFLEPKADDQPSKSRISWARLLKRVFNIDVETCHLCAGQMKIIASIEDPQVIKKILEHLDLPSKPPMPWPARGPPQRPIDPLSRQN